MDADPFTRFAEQLAVLDTFERDRMVHWADPLFRGLLLERKVMTSLVGEAAARRAEAPVDGVLVIDLMACGGSIGAVDVIRRTIPAAREVAYVGFGLPLRGSRGLIERGLEDLVRRSPGPPMRSAFYSGSFFDIVQQGEAWAEVLDHYDWILAWGFEGRVGRRGPEPLRPEDCARLALADASVVSFLDPAALAASLPRLALLAESIGQGIRVSVEALVDGRVVDVGEVQVPPGPDLEEARIGLGRALDAASRFAHRAALRPCGDLGVSGETVECVSDGFARDHLLAGLDVLRVVPAGAVRIVVAGS
ncbi:MAG: hypothetical protein JRG91_15260 [Deltaproteobacteria bacterium]|nr:hypothetical protein [Deltaproteobacteria bacterium]